MSSCLPDVACNETRTFSGNGGAVYVKVEKHQSKDPDFSKRYVVHVSDGTSEERAYVLSILT